MNIARRAVLIIILSSFVIMGASSQFGFRPASHTTAVSLTTSTIGHSGRVDKELLYWAVPGDTLDTLGGYFNATTGSQSLRIGIYMFNDDSALYPESLVFLDTITGIVSGAANYNLDVHFGFPIAKRWYGIQICSLGTALQFFQGNNVIWESGSGSKRVGEDDRANSTGMVPNPYGSGTVSTSDNVGPEAWGVVQHVAVAAGRNKVTFVSSRDTVHNTAQTTCVIGAPSGMQNGDVLVACIVKGDDPAVSGWPTGWVKVHQSTLVAVGDDQHIVVGYKIITNAGGEGSSYTWTGDSEEWSGGIMCFRNVDTFAIFDASPRSRYDTTAAASAMDPVCLSITTRTDSAMAIVFATASACDTGTATVNNSATEVWERHGGAATFNTSVCAYKLINTAGATGTFTWTFNDVTASDAFSVTMALRPAAPPDAHNSKIITPGVLWICNQDDY
jgi:hypothetical protein